MELLKINNYMDDFKSRVKNHHSKNTEGDPLNSNFTFQTHIENLTFCKTNNKEGVGIKNPHFQLKELNFHVEKVNLMHKILKAFTRCKF